MKRKLLFVLFAFCGVGLSFAQNSDITSGVNSDDVQLVTVDGNLDVAESLLFSGKYNEVKTIAAVKWQGEDENTDFWAAKDGQSPTYNGTDILTFKETNGVKVLDTPVGRWVSFALDGTLYFYVEVYKQNPSNNGSGSDSNNHGTQPAYAGDAVEIYVSDANGQKQYGIAYNPTGAANKTYGAEAVGTITMAQKTYTSALGPDKKDGWILEALIPVKLSADNKCKVEVAIAQEGVKDGDSSAHGRQALVNTFSNSPSNYNNAGAYKEMTVESKQGQDNAETKPFWGTCSDIVIDGEMKDNEVWASIWKEKNYNKIEASNRTMGSHYSLNEKINRGSRGDGVFDNADNCLSKAYEYAWEGKNYNGEEDSSIGVNDANVNNKKGDNTDPATVAVYNAARNSNIEKGSTIAEWQAIRREEDKNSLYFLIKVYDENPVLRDDYSWKSDAIEIYLLENVGGTEQTEKIFVRYNEENIPENTAEGQGKGRGGHMSDANTYEYKQSQSDGYWMLEIKVTPKAGNTIVGLDADKPQIQAEVAVDMVTDSKCNCRLGQVYTWYAIDYDKIENQGNLRTIELGDRTPKTVVELAELGKCAYAISINDGSSITKVEKGVKDGNNIKWETIVENQNEKVIYHTPGEPVYYRAFVDGINVCESEQEYVAIVDMDLNLLSKNPQTIYVGDEATVSVNRANKDGVADPKDVTYTYSWKENGEDLGLAETEDSYLVADKLAGEYVYDIECVSSQNCTAKVQSTVIVKLEELVLPTAIDISANGISSGVNVLGAGAGEKLVVFNREGIKVYDEKVSKPEDMSGWNGCWDNKTSKPADPGIYFYVLERKGDKTYKGTVEVLNSDK